VPTIDWGAGVPAHEQIAAAIRAEIASGVLKPGDKLPHRDELAEAWGTSHVTISRALGVLQAEHLVYHRPSKGIYIS